MNTLKLWYKQPSPTWTHSLPLGNGHLGAMVDGGIYDASFSLNEDTLWSGYPRNLNLVDDASAYEQARDLALNQEYAAAEKVLEDKLLGPWTQSYLPLGDFNLKFNLDTTLPISEYTRELDLQTACHTTNYKIGDTYISQESFISHSHDALFVRITSSTPNFLSVTASLSSQLKSEVTASNHSLKLDGIAPSHVEPNYIPCTPEEGVVYFDEPERKGMLFSTVLMASTEGGTLTSKDGVLTIIDASSITFILSARTSFNGASKHPYLESFEYTTELLQTLHSAKSMTFEEAKSNHISAYQEYFNRLSLELPASAAEQLPTDERLKQFVDDKSDTSLAALLFHYGRYLLTSSSLPGTQPANLQGIWNKDLRAPWSANYTVNINTEMNYWPAEVCNLSELHQPLFDLIKDISIKGQETAKKYYNASGFVTHHNIDLWRHTTPVGNHGGGSSVYAFWNLSSGWLSAHLYQHYLYTLDKDFLEAVYPILEQAAHFYSDLLVKDDSGYYFLPLSTSPENCFVHEGKGLSVCETTTMTSSIVRHTFQNYLDAMNALGIESPLKTLIATQLDEFIPYAVSARGTLLEWHHDFEETDPYHRHVSHLYPLFPGEEFTFESTPDLVEASKQSLLVRGDDGTGWSLGWKINLWAKLRDGNHALKLVERQLRLVDTTGTQMHHGGGTYTNLFDAHPPFQIDGNFGATSGIAHMLVESHLGFAYLLPALPDKWHTGSVSGLKLKGNITLDMKWENGALIAATFTSPIPQTLQVKVGDHATSIELVANEAYNYTLKLVK